MKRLSARAKISGLTLIEVLVLFFICFFWRETAAQSVTFTTNAFTVGYAPITVVAADVNGDDKLDLISANYGSSSGNVGDGNTLTVLTNNGNGGFGFNATITLNNVSGNVLAADVNGDGKVDLISANSQTNMLTILTNNGSGVFGFNATVTVGTNPVFVAAADVNGDGKMDLISANYGSFGVFGNTLTVLTNNGRGVFGSNATLTVGQNPQCVLAADVNGDGKMDLISANFGASTLTVLTNNGNGIFGFNATLPVGSNPRRVIAADMNGDGKVDLISANFLGGTLTVLTNNGNGGFGFNATLTVGAGVTSVAAADVNGDGKLDLIIGNYITQSSTANTLTLLMNTFPFPAPISTPKLTLNYQGNGVCVSWPSVSPGWSLQEDSDLTQPNWLPSGYGDYSIADDGTNKSLTLPYLNGSRFFRLLHP